MRTPSAFSRRSSARPRSKSSISTPSVISSSSRPGCRPVSSRIECTRLDQIAVHELRRRQVDRDLQRLWPGCRFPAGLAQNPFAHLDDQAALLGERNEIAGRHEAADRMDPARQRLEADDVAAFDACPALACG